MSDDANSSPMRVAAITAHEMYTEFRKAGFSRRDAVELMAKILVSGMQANDDN